MNGWLVDTNVISEFSRPRPHSAAVGFLADKPLDQLFVSTVTFAEIRFGLAVVTEPESLARLDEWLRETRLKFTGRVLEVTEETMFIWRTLMAQGRKSNRTYSQPDLILAATAIEHDVTLATRNVKDFRDLPVRVINPWTT